MEPVGSRRFLSPALSLLRGPPEHERQHEPNPAVPRPTAIMEGAAQYCGRGFLGRFHGNKPRDSQADASRHRDATEYV
jgi:hypothetical protein